MYSVIGANGKERPTTLRDARKYDLVPSVTTILRCAAAPGLDVWKRQNLLMAAATLPRVEGESADDWMKRVGKDADQQAADARELGTEIHGDIERYCAGEPVTHVETCRAVMRMVDLHYPGEDWQPERSFASELGFGGKIDLSSSNVVIDFKTSAFGPDDKKDGYDEHLMQLAAYAAGLGIERPRCANIFVSTTHEGLCKLVEWTEADLARGLKMFMALLLFWQAKNGVMQ